MSTITERTSERRQRTLSIGCALNRWVARVAVAMVAVAAVTSSATASASAAEFGLDQFDASAVNTQAGAHSDVTTTIGFNLMTFPPPKSLFGPLPVENVRSIALVLPPGLLANAAKAPACSRSDFNSSGQCPPETQVGNGVVMTSPLFAYATGGVLPVNPIYNVTPAQGEPAALGLTIGSSRQPAMIDVGVRNDGSYQVTASSTNLETIIPIFSLQLTLWGVPAASIHDALRYDPSGACTHDPVTGSCSGGFPGYGNPSPVRPTPFMVNPADCGTVPVTTVRVTSYDHPDAVVTATAASPKPMHCERLDFRPTIDVTPDTTAADAPTGLGMDLRFPQIDEPDGFGTPALRKAVVALPDGMTINPDAADGLASCSDAQSAIGTEAAASCPDAAKIGTVEIDVPALRKPLNGAVYIGSQQSNDPASGKMFRIFLVANGQGVHLKLEGAVRADPATGRVTATFADNPQVPVSEISLHFRGGPRAVLATPASCGSKTATAQLTSWGGQVANVTSSFEIACRAGLGSFAPGFASGSSNPVAGASAPFVMRFSRTDGQQELGALNGSLPPGLLGVLASVPLCSAAQGAAGTCPAASRVGKVQVAAGPGTEPLWLPVAGQAEDAIYLTEPFRKGDVAGMSIVVPAVAGPFDLGRVVTKVYLKLRPADQGIDMQSEQLPRIVGGVPVRLREVRVIVDRDGFMVNPTNCSAMATYANVFSQSWTKAPVTDRFQVGGCASLAMSPIITASAGGKGNTKRYEHPALKVAIRQAAGQAHLSKANVVLPKELNIDLKAPALKASCPRMVYAKDQCSPVATVGTVKAITPLLREPLVGPAFLLQKKGELPDIVMRLRNNRMSLDLIGVLDFLKDGRLITRVKGIPDAALSSFVLNINGGKNGSLLNRTDLCAHKRLTKATFKGQNGKLARKTPVTRISGCASKASTSRAASRRAARAASAKASAAQTAGARASAVGSPAGAAHADSVHQRAAGGRS